MTLSFLNTKGQRIKGSKGCRGENISFSPSTFDPLILCPFVLKMPSKNCLADYFERDRSAVSSQIVTGPVL